ncbi:hypothetical protein FACS1894190_08520 [Spirochaetia bacterium]|nr:hypothetical protein FACS1894190_08520 [Spirochaetia bacterium]
MQEADAEAKIQCLIREAYKKLKEANPEDALAALNGALRVNYECEEALYTLKCLNWWLEKIKNLDAAGDSYSKGAFIISQWKSYLLFLNRLGIGFDTSRYAVRHFVYGLALGFYKEVLEDGSDRFDPSLFFQIGRCYKGVGDYVSASEYLGKVVHFKKEDALALSELADVKAMLGETREAKVLFREAFFIDPQGVDIDSLESALIRSLIDNVASRGYSGGELLERLPVYAALMGLFSVKREIKLAELGRLKQAIFSLENEVRNNHEDKNVLIPNLINKYLWLMDYYESVHENPSAIEEIKLKIKIIEPDIYDRFFA